MKKISALLIALAMLLMLAGCTELKTYEIPKDGAASPAAQETSKEETAKPAEESTEETTEAAGPHLYGSGMFIVNPPWKLREEMEAVAGYMEGKLRR